MHLSSTLVFSLRKTAPLSFVYHCRAAIYNPPPAVTCLYITEIRLLNLLLWFTLGSSDILYGEIRGWGGTVFFKTKFASIWIEWSSINSPLNWLLAGWLLLMLSIPYRHFLHSRMHRLTPLTSAQQHTLMHFILPRLKLNRVGDSTHRRKKHKRDRHAWKATDSLQGYEGAQQAINVQCGAHLHDYVHPHQHINCY